MTKLDLTQQAAHDQFSQQSHRYASGHILENVEDVEQAASFLDLPVGSEILDVACGAGHTGLFFAAQGHRVTCSDLSSEMLARTQEAAARRGIVVTTTEHSAEVLPYADASFDLVTCRVAPHHFSSPERFVAETGRILRPGGSFLLIDGTVPDHSAEAGAWLNRLEKLRDPSHVRLLSPSEWEGLCTRAGLEVARSFIYPKKQPDLKWYFEAAATSPENRVAVRSMVASASTVIREIYQIATENATIVWQWPMLCLIAHKSR